MSATGARPRVERTPFGTAPDGAAVELFTLTNSRGCEARVITWGCILVSLRLPDRDGMLDDVVLGHDDLAGYLTASPYFGAVVGRYANRIAGGRFTLDGETYQLATNDGPNHLHGGVRGFDKAVWAPSFAERAEGVALILRHRSPDGDEGYPGALDAQVAYTLTERDELIVEYRATTDRATHVNLTQHSYFNLACGRADDVLGHVLTLNADAYTPVHADQIPTGGIEPVDGTPFDFRAPAPIGQRIGERHLQLRHGGGYDHNWVLRRSQAGCAPAASVVEPLSGRTLEVSTTEPGIQFYSGNQLDGTITGKGARRYTARAALCLETQGFPDAPNQPAFPSTVLRPGQRLRARTIFRFGVVRRA